MNVTLLRRMVPLRPLWAVTAALPVVLGLAMLGPQAAPGWRWVPLVILVAGWGLAREQRLRQRLAGRTAALDVAGRDLDLACERLARAEADLATLRGHLEEEICRRLDAETAARDARALTAERDRAEASSNLKSSILTTLSHEIRTPITAILGSAEILAAELEASGIDVEAREFVSLIEENSRRLLDTLTSLLDLSSFDAEGFVLQPQIVDVAAAVAAVAARYRADAARKGLALYVTPPDRPATAWLDAPALDRVLARLVDNAVKFTDRGEVELRVSADAAHVAVAVRDTGIGIGPDFSEHLFEAWQQESAGTARLYEGTGLGLAVARRLVEAMGGRIEARSRKHAGSTFTVTFPRAATERG